MEKSRGETFGQPILRVTRFKNQTDFGDDLGNFMIQALNEIRDNTSS